MDIYIEKMAKAIIHYSTDVKPDERVLIRVTSPAGQPLAQALYREALRTGAYAFTYIHMSDENSLAMEATDNLDLLAAPNPMLELMYQTCDVVIRVDASENPSALSDYPTELQRARGKSAGAILKIQMEREGNGSMRRCSTLFPTQGYAQAAGMSLQQYERFVYHACKLHLDDPVAGWLALSKEQQRLVNWLQGKKHLKVTGKNIDMEMSIEGRTFINSNGKSNFPSGEIFTGPVEDSVNGWVNFTYPAYYGGNRVDGVSLAFKDGVVAKATAEKNEAFLLAAIDSDPGARRLGEFAIGTNRDIQRFTGSILFDEKIGGTVHMALGQGYPHTGSVNKSSIHWDMICDMRDGGEIWVDGELFYRNGEFVV